MGKLFGDSERFATESNNVDVEERLDDNLISDTIDEYNDDLNISIEGFKRSYNELETIDKVRTSINSKEIGSVGYFVSIENHSLLLDSIANNLGLKTNIPTMEDFKNPYGINTCHTLVLEDLTSFIKSIWEKIKDFFKTFFKKVMLFFKRLSNANLELDEYEDYIDDVIQNVKRSDKESVEPILIESKLPYLLAEPDTNNVTVSYIMTKGEMALNNLHDFNKDFIRDDLGTLVKCGKEYVDDLKSTIKTDVESNLHRINFNKATSLIVGNLINKQFSIRVDLNKVPDEVYNEITSAFDRDECNKDNLVISSVINENENYRRLPKNFNLYLAYSTYVDIEEDSGISKHSKLILTSATNPNKFIKKELYTIDNKSELIKFYEFYKKFKKNIDTKKYTNMINDYSKVITATIETMSIYFSDANKLVENIKSVSVVTESDDIIDFSGIEGARRTTDGPNEYTIDNTKPENNTEHINVTPKFNSVDSGGDNTTKDQKEALISLKEQQTKQLNELQSFMLNYLNSLQILIKEISTNIIGMETEIRYEMIKYIYKSAKQF